MTIIQNPSYSYSVNNQHSYQIGLRTNSLMKYLDKYGFCSLFRSKTKWIHTKSTGLGPQGAGVFNRWAASCLSYPVPCVKEVSLKVLRFQGYNDFVLIWVMIYFITWIFHLESVQKAITPLYLCLIKNWAEFANASVLVSFMVKLFVALFILILRNPETISQSL